MSFPYRIAALLIASLCLTIAATAQRRRPAVPRTPAPVQVAAQAPAPTLENLLASDSFRVYGEVRGVGQLLKSSSFKDLLEPIMKMSAPPKEFQTLMKWLDSESDALTTSRMVIATMAARPSLPAVLLAIEFGSTEEAQKFEPRLKTFLPKFFPKPTPEKSDRPGEKGNTEEKSNTPSTSAAVVPAARPVGAPTGQAPAEAKPQQAVPRYEVRQAGSLVFISDMHFTFKDLRPAGSKPLAEDASFRRAHDRFATESVFFYFDTAGMERTDQQRRRELEEMEQKRAEAEAANPTAPQTEDESIAETTETPEEPPTASAPESPDVIPQTAVADPVLIAGSEPPPEPKPNPGMEAVGRISRLFFAGRTAMPDGLGLALAFEPDSYSVRLLLVNEPGVKGVAIPFLPQLISGPPIVPESPSVFPAATELFVVLSLDYQQIYDELVKQSADDEMASGVRISATDPVESPFAAYEKNFGFKIKDDLIPLLGNEIALSLPVKSLDVGPSQPAPKDSTDEKSAKEAQPQGPTPVVAIAIKDREGVRALIPKLLDSFGFKGASLLAQTEKRGDTEIVNYANALSYAFVGNFLLVSPDPKGVRAAVDSYLNNETLSAEGHFRNYTRWHNRQLLGQFYVSPALMDSYRDFARTMDSSITDQLGDLLSRLNPTAEPVTYALSNEGSGPLHEMRIPKNLALLTLASVFGAANQQPAVTNEIIAQSQLHTIVSAETTYKETAGKGSYGTIEQLVSSNLFPKDALAKYGYKYEVNVSATSFEISAVPQEYGKTGKMSFFVDQSGVIRGGDHGGGAATVADKAID